jgi:hypothetical protein
MNGLSLKEDLEARCMHVCTGAAHLRGSCGDHNRSGRYRKLVSSSRIVHLITPLCISERLISRLGQQRDP